MVFSKYMKVCDALSLINTIECNSTCISVTPNEPQTLKLNLIGTHRKEHKKMKEKKKKAQPSPLLTLPQTCTRLPP